ncbi:MAG TPA: universal stress protein [Candidatus Polarisedimenticolia bacterium]|nr:universal stress protein [Candidatus Polarisedimenticolia bacterium]
MRRDQTSGKRRRWILVGMDFSPASLRALAAARGLSSESDRPVMVLHVIDGQGLTEVSGLAGMTEEVLRDRLGRARRERLAASIAPEAGAEAGAPVETAMAWGRPFEAILRKATELPASLIVLGTAGHSADLERALFGSTAEKVLRAAPCPVLCVPAD